MAPYIERPESRQLGIAYLRSLLSPAELKNGWQLAEENGGIIPYGFQHRLSRAFGDPEAVRVEQRYFVIQHLGAADAVFVIDLAASPAEGWTRLSTADGTMGTRGYDWRWLPLAG